MLERNSRSFALAARLLPTHSRDFAAVLYAYCRHVDDAIDEVPAKDRTAALIALREEADALFGSGNVDGVVLRAMRVLIDQRQLPRAYVDELIAGMEMDVRLDAGQWQYDTERQLLQYCHRVAGVVGLMCCHVLGVRHDRALRPAAKLGWAMQLTNISRDVAEDWAMGRRYLPAQWFEAASVAVPNDELAPETRRVVAHALRVADRYYADAREGYVDLDAQSALAIEVAARVYREIGTVLRERECDVLAGRAVVSRRRKARVLLRSIRSFAGALPSRPLRGSFVIPTRVYQFSDLCDEE